MNLDRPAILTGLADACGAVVATFGASPAAILDLVFGAFSPSGKLPFELPSSMEAVRAQLSDVPCDSERPLFPLGHGLTYPARHLSSPVARLRARVAHRHPACIHVRPTRYSSWPGSATGG